MKTVTVKTAELEGVTLDYCVAKVEEIKGLTPTWCKTDNGDIVCWIEKDNLGLIGTYSPSRDWQCGGPIIDHYNVVLMPSLLSDGGCYAYFVVDGGFSDQSWGPTYLIAAMRAIVQAELGDTVEIPEELVK